MIHHVSKNGGSIKITVKLDQNIINDLTIWSRFRGIEIDYEN
jgi:hypothetical protein